MKSKVVFNFYELTKRTRYDLDGIIILLYGLQLGYNETINKSLSNLCKHLMITRIPAHLFYNKCLHLAKDRVITIKYKTEEPLSYITNTEFIAYKISPKIKVDYLELLSKRSLSNNNKFIPITYVDSIKKYKNNPLINIVNDKIHFTLEE